MTVPETPPPVARGRGRPKSLEAEQRMLRAAIEALSADGISGLTVEGICERAGVPRSTFYRRWSSAAEAVGEAVKGIVGETVPPAPDTGDVRQDITLMAEGMVDLLNNGPFGRVLGFMMAEIPQNPSFRDAAMEIARHRRRFSARVLERGEARGEISADLDAEVLIEVLAGALIFRQFFGETPPDRAYVKKLVDLVFASAARREPKAS